MHKVWQHSMLTRCGIGMHIICMCFCEEVYFFGVYWLQFNLFHKLCAYVFVQGKFIHILFYSETLPAYLLLLCFHFSFSLSPFYLTELGCTRYKNGINYFQNRTNNTQNANKALLEWSCYAPNANSFPLVIRVNSYLNVGTPTFYTFVQNILYNECIMFNNFALNREILMKMLAICILGCFCYLQLIM